MRTLQAIDKGEVFRCFPTSKEHYRFMSRFSRTLLVIEIGEMQEARMKERGRMGGNTGTRGEATMSAVRFSQDSHTGRSKRRQRLDVRRLQRAAPLAIDRFAVLLLTAPSSQRPIAKV